MELSAAPRAVVTRDDLAECFALDHLHHDVDAAFGLAYFVNRGDVGMAGRGGGAGVPNEARDTASAHCPGFSGTSVALEHE